MAFSESRQPMGDSGLMMSADGGPMMSGTWVNPKTGHRFTVRDCFFQDGNFMVQTTTGQMLDYNTIKNYVQASSGDVPVQEKPKKKAAKKQATNEIPQEIMEQLLPEDEQLIKGTKGLGNINANHAVPYEPDSVEWPPRVVQKPASSDQLIIERVLNDKPLPMLNATIDWVDTPVEQIRTLIDVLGVSPKEIAEYYYQRANLDQAAIKELVHNVITDYILKDICGATPETKEPESAVKSAKKKTTKKNTKKKE